MLLLWAVTNEVRSAKKQIDAATLLSSATERPEPGTRRQPVVLVANERCVYQFIHPQRRVNPSFHGGRYIVCVFQFE